MFEDNIQAHITQEKAEKTYVDKLLARNEAERVKDLIRKDRLSRSELLELLYMCLSVETKLTNLNSDDRYIILKYFVWIGEFIKVAELLYDYKDWLVSQEKKKNVVITIRTKTLLENNEKLIEHNAKFLIDLYFNILRTSLSVGGTAFTEILKNKYEINYPQAGMNLQAEMPKKKWFGLG